MVKINVIDILMTYDDWHSYSLQENTCKENPESALYYLHMRMRKVVSRTMPANVYMYFFDLIFA